MTLVEYLVKEVEKQIEKAKTVLDEEDFKEFCKQVKNYAWDNYDSCY